MLMVLTNATILADAKFHLAFAVALPFAAEEGTAMNQSPNTTPTACSDRSVQACRGGTAHAGEQLPIVIRPRPLELGRLERMLQQDQGFAARLAANPLHLHLVARAVFHRDLAAQAQFRDLEALTSHLQALL